MAMLRTFIIVYCVTVIYISVAANCNKELSNGWENLNRNLESNVNSNELDENLKFAKRFLDVSWVKKKAPKTSEQSLQNLQAAVENLIVLSKYQHCDPNVGQTFKELNNVYAYRQACLSRIDKLVLPELTKFEYACERFLTTSTTLKRFRSQLYELGCIEKKRPSSSASSSPGSSSRFQSKPQPKTYQASATRAKAEPTRTPPQWQQQQVPSSESKPKDEKQEPLEFHFKRDNTIPNDAKFDYTITTDIGKVAYKLFLDLPRYRL